MTSAGVDTSESLTLADATHTLERVDRAADVVRARFARRPDVAIILGTGLGGLATRIGVEASIEYADIPGFPLSTVESHAGRLLCGTLSGKTVVAMQGRFHRYEGYSLAQVTFPVRVLRALGAQTLVVSNACGGMHPLWAPGELMLIADHINLLGDNPLVGPNEDLLGKRFPDMTHAYDPRLCRFAREAAAETGVDLREGFYASMLGPTYETPAEIAMLRVLGAHAVGMSTVLEVIALCHQGVRVGAVSCITNLAAGLAGALLDHAEVEAAARAAAPRFARLLSGWIQGAEPGGH